MLSIFTIHKLLHKLKIFQNKTETYSFYYYESPINDNCLKFTELKNKPYFQR